MKLDASGTQLQRQVIGRKWRKWTLKSSDSSERAQLTRVDFSLDLAPRERVPEAQSLVSRPRDDRLSIRRSGEVQDLRRRKVERLGQKASLGALHSLGKNDPSVVRLAAS